jgi:transcriptional regulator with XRE-family HTH domain
MLKDYYTQQEAAEKLGRTRQTLHRWRQEEKGPPWTDFMGRILYPREEFDTWMSSELNTDTNDDGPKAA